MRRQRGLRLRTLGPTISPDQGRPKQVKAYDDSDDACSSEAWQGRIEDLLTERPTVVIPRLCHKAQAKLLRKQQVLGSNPRVGSTPLFRAQEDLQLPSSTVLVCVAGTGGRANWRSWAAGFVVGPVVRGQARIKPLTCSGPVCG
jgi:hypothetical protein